MTRSNRVRLYNILAILFLTLTVLSGGLTVWIATHPQSPLNPFPVLLTPTLIPTATPTDTPTITPTPLPTATPTLTPTATLTLTPSLTPTTTPTFTPLPTIAPAWMEVIIAGKGYAIHLPNTWVVFDLTERDPTATLDQIAEENPALYTSLSQSISNVDTESFSLLAFDSTSVDAPFIINLNVAEASAAEGRTVDDVLATRETTYSQTPGHVLIESTALVIDGQPAAQMLYTSELEVEVEQEEQDEGLEEEPTPEAATLTIHHRDVIIRRPDRGVMMLAFVIDSERLEEYNVVVDQVLSTFRFSR